MHTRIDAYRRIIMKSRTEPFLHFLLLLLLFRLHDGGCSRFPTSHDVDLLPRSRPLENVVLIRGLSESAALAADFAFSGDEWKLGSVEVFD